MTLQQTIRVFEVIASHQPSINMVVKNDIFRLNACPSARYGVFGWTQGTHSSSTDAGFINYQFTFFYVDRLKSDRSNEIEIQSVGIETLDNIIRRMNDRGLYVDDYTMQVFNQKFMDECAGVFTNLTISVPVNTMCAEGYGDFNDDFNDDFYVY